MMIWTSRYSNKELQKDDCYCVGISLGRPRFKIKYILRKQCYDLAPDRSMWGKELDEFRKLYFAKLDKMGTEKVRNILSALYMEAQENNKKLVLLCFEDVRIPGDWCHRTILAEWVQQNLGWNMQELFNPDLPKRKKSIQKQENPQQLSLFDYINA